MATRATKKTVAAEAVEPKEVKAAATAEPKAPAGQQTAKKAAAPKKEEAVKEEAAAKKEEAVKEEAAPVKRTAAKKTVAEKKAAAHTEPEVSVIFEYSGRQIAAKEVLVGAMEAFRTAHADVEIKELKLYVNADDSCAYIVVNGEEYPEDKIEIL